MSATEYVLHGNVAVITMNSTDKSNFPISPPF